MKREVFFSHGGFYSFIVNSNELMHYEAIETGTKVVKQHFNSIKSQKIRILDLACGGQPIGICKIMEALPEFQFEYVGIDINADQICDAKKFDRFSKNVISTQFVEGNAWQLNDYFEGESFDFIFSGMNTHHALPDELRYLASCFKSLLKTQGLFFSHDFYRPEKYSYLQRPRVNRDDKNDNMMLVDSSILSNMGFSKASSISEPAQTDDFDWREIFIKDCDDFLRAAKAKEDYVIQNSDHIRARDFPVSVNEMVSLFKEFGFRSEVHRNELGSHPLAEYFSFLVFYRDEG